MGKAGFGNGKAGFRFVLVDLSRVYVAVGLLEGDEGRFIAVCCYAGPEAEDGDGGSGVEAEGGCYA